MHDYSCNTYFVSNCSTPSRIIEQDIMNLSVGRNNGFKSITTFNQMVVIKTFNQMVTSHSQILQGVGLLFSLQQQKINNTTRIVISEYG